MKPGFRQSSRAPAFTLLEVVIVLAITALVLTAIYSIATSTLTLADDVHRAGRRDARTQAFTAFCERLFGELPATALLNINVTKGGGQYLTRLELEHVRSPFDETPDCRVILFTQAQPGGGLRLQLTCHAAGRESTAVLFEDLAQCDWSVFHPTTRKWAASWAEENPEGAPPVAHLHPQLLKLELAQAGGYPSEQVFWITPVEAVRAASTPVATPPTPALTAPARVLK